jgi:hypothetical protein
MGRSVGEPVGRLVVEIARMSPDPAELHIVPLTKVEETTPQVRIGRLLALVASPGVRSPPLSPPLLYRIDEVLRVAIKGDLALPVQSFQGADGGHQLHAIVGSETITFGKLSALATIDQDRPIPPAARITEAGAIGVDDDVLESAHGE